MEQLEIFIFLRYILTAIIVLIILFFIEKTLFPSAREKKKFREPDPAKLYAPERTGNFKFVEENPEKYVLYAEYEKWEVEETLSFGIKKTFWQRANTEDMNYYFDKKMLGKHGRVR